MRDFFMNAPLNLELEAWDSDDSWSAHNASRSAAISSRFFKEQKYDDAVWHLEQAFNSYAQITTDYHTDRLHEIAEIYNEYRDVSRANDFDLG